MNRAFRVCSFLAAISLCFVLSACAPATYSVAPSEQSISFRKGPFALRRQLSEIDTVKVGDYPKSVYLSPDQKFAYVCNLEQGTVDVISTEDGRRVRELRFHRTPITISLKGKPFQSFEEKPVEIGFTGNGRYVWISLLNSGGVVVLDTKRRRWPAGVATRPVDVYDSLGKKAETMALRFVPTGRQPKIIAPTPDGKLVLVANWKGHAVTVVDAATYKKVKDIDVGVLPRGIAFAGGEALVANFGSHTLSVLDLKELKRTRTIRNVGKNPRHLVMAPDEKSVYVSNHGDAYIRQIDIATGETLRKCHVGGEPRTIALSSRKNFLFVANYHDDTVSAVDLVDMVPILTVKTIRRPIGVSVDSRSDTVWVTGYWDRAVRRYRFASATERIEALTRKTVVQTASR